MKQPVIPNQRSLFEDELPFNLLAYYVGNGVESVYNLIEAIILEAPLSHYTTPGGFQMSAKMSACGEFGWVSSQRGYQYVRKHPVTHKRWPSMPPLLYELALKAAKASGFNHFTPNSCLINQYSPGAKMSLHQDKDEHDVSQPIVSLSLGLPVVFVFGGLKRNSPTHKVILSHGDAIVWGGEHRLAYHGVQTLKEGEHPLVGPYRYNLTFRYVNL